MIKGIHHFAVIVSSERSLDFYTRLGFTPSFRLERRTDTVVLLDGYGIQIEMFIDPSHPPRMTDPETIGVRHLALQVDNIEDTIGELGVEPGRIMTDWTGVRFTFISDPDGLPVELHE